MLAIVLSIIIALLDTGIDVTHPHFEGVTISGVTTDECGHGTALAGIILDNARDVEILSIDVETNCKSYAATIATAIHHAVDSGAQIVVVAWHVTADIKCIADAIAYAEQHGVQVVLSDGLESMTLYAPKLSGGYGWFGGASGTAAWVAGRLTYSRNYFPIVTVDNN